MGNVRQEQQWIRLGVDIWMIRDNLRLTFEERVLQHQRLLDLTDELREIGRENRERSSSTSQATHS